MDIQIPSPSVFLRASPSPTTASANPTAPKKPAKPRGANKKKPTTTDAAVTKPKQSKSRNGCMTCKKKRLKCDEIKPSCQQCQKRNVVCEGYKKDYKWRSFEETTLNSRTATKKKAQPYNSRGGRWSPGLESAFASASHAFQDAPTSIPNIVSPSDDPLPELPSHMQMPELDTPFDPSRIELPSPGSSFDIDTPPIPVIREDTGSKSPNSFSAGSPQQATFEASKIDSVEQQDNSNSNSTESPPRSPPDFNPDNVQDNILNSHEEADEEIIRELNLAKESRAWRDRQGSPALSEDSNSSKTSELTLLPAPDFDISSPEMLMIRFDRYTCGILSVKDGPTENPWRTLVWPLAKDSEALYHAISSMTAFHGAHEDRRLRVSGMGHMTKSIRKLAADIENMRLDAALATSLALALSEGWDEKTSTGIQHLRGAKIMVNGAIVKHRQDVEQGRLTAQDDDRLKFLCNTFIYLDVIARLTSNEEALDLNFEDILFTVNPPQGGMMEVDPLMGCATTLFPIIARVANLIQRVRKMERNSLTIVSQAMELKQQLLQWETPDYFSFEAPEDPSSEVQHSIQTAEAYRYAALLYLHQAVPEIPTDSSEILSKRVLVFLASVPLSSRTTIIQIFPLFAASCEVVTQEDRQWVTERWSAMTSRLRIGNVDSCWKIVKEVWLRRDTFEAEKSHRLMRRYTSRGLSTGNLMAEVPTLTRRTTTSEIPFDQIEPEYTIRGNLHWLGVMSDWGWEEDDDDDL